MSKLEELIQKYCPDGVEYVPLSAIGTIKRGNGLQKKDFVQSGVGCIHYGQIYTRFGTFAEKPLTYVTEELASHLLQVKKGDLVIACTSENVEDVCKAVAWMGDDTIVTGGHSCVLQHNQNPKYIAYFFQTEDFQQQKRKYAYGTKVIDIKPDNLGKILIPLPPIPVQEEIVRVLDTFTELQAELQAEQQKRLQQYNYYRDQLLAGDGSFKRCKLLDLLSQPITDGPHTTPQFFQTGVPFVSVDAVWDGKIHFEKQRGFISPDFDKECSKKYKPKRDDVFMVKSGSTTGKVAYVDTDVDFNIWSPLAAMRVNDNTSSRYLFHLLQTSQVQEQVITKSSQGSQPNLSMRVLEQFDVDVPPLSRQVEIASILDRFYTLTTDLTAGLPAEIEKRRQQYEFYRDKLLTFKRKEA